jgi:hypothetical protein
MANRIQLRRDTTANWANVNPILSDGEMGYDIVTNEIRIGDGSTAWTGLTANTISGGGGASTGDVTFNGINIIGDDNLRFQPNVSATDGYIDIYLTTGPDIHIDSNGGNLILGKDSSANVRVAGDGNVQIRAQNIGSTSTWTFDASGNLTLPAGGEIKTAAGTGNVVIEANDGVSRIWKFVSNAALIFPDSTVQTTAYVAANNVSRATGTWTVATGSATYSFTVPENGTYVMWVRGNIPNGILAWNATATVTNDNVPVLGQQFAWNYADAGTPIALTALPHQFVGTSNTIITTMPSVGTSTNTFTFTINNTSGESGTVYWGYVAQ